MSTATLEIVIKLPSQSIKATELLQEIVNKGGLIGQCGRHFLNNEELAAKFIIACSVQCQYKVTFEKWGKKLENKIKNFAKVVQN